MSKMDVKNEMNQIGVIVLGLIELYLLMIIHTFFNQCN